jgi:transcriptional regulator with GAF, ATPase, and Fis domain
MKADEIKFAKNERAEISSDGNLKGSLLRHYGDGIKFEALPAKISLNKFEMITEKITSAPEVEMQKLNLQYGLTQGILIGPDINTGKDSQARKSVYSSQYPGIIGNCAEMQKVYRLMTMVAPSNSTVLLLGETGTGKEVIARGIHQTSARKNKPMVTVNCAALPANLIESELFGHERGSFTGALDRRIGKFELAHQGTIFLDEIGELPLELQVKLLRVIQEREFERVGGKAIIKVDARIIAATNRDLDAEVDAHRFRADLYYRLNVFPICLPPLRERQNDIADLADFFLSRYCKITGKKINFISNRVLQQLRSYSWPGNVRQLEHLIERSILLSDDNVLKHICLPNETNKNINDREVFNNRTLIDVERNHIITVLKKCSGKIAGEGGAAEWLDVPATTLHAKMKKLNIVKQDYFPQKV